MISNGERKTLLDIERQFMVEDPEFARSFHRHLVGDDLRRPPVAKRVSNGRLVVGAATVFCVALLLAGPAVVALMCLIAPMVLFGVWSCSKGPDPERPGPDESGR